MNTPNNYDSLDDNGSLGGKWGRVPDGTTILAEVLTVQYAPAHRCEGPGHIDGKMRGYQVVDGGHAALVQGDFHCHSFEDMLEDFKDMLATFEGAFKVVLLYRNGDLTAVIRYDPDRVIRGTANIGQSDDPSGDLERMFEIKPAGRDGQARNFSAN